MSTHDKARRDFLIHTAAGVGAAAVAVVPETRARAAEAQAQPDSMPMRGETVAAASNAAAVGRGEGVGAFFNMSDALTIRAIAERIMPGAPGKAGATDCAVTNYIDLALSGAYSRLQDFYRSGLKQLNAYCRAAHTKTFASLPPAQQDEVLIAMQDGKATGFEWPTSRDFFETLRRHTMEGMFADPVYGGNKNYAGWRLVGFPGAQESFTEKELAAKEPFTRKPIVGMQS